MTTCLACGFEGTDEEVRMKLVEYTDRQPVQFGYVKNERHGYTGQAIIEYITVPGRYGAEWRCLDYAACRERQTT